MQFQVYNTVLRRYPQDRYNELKKGNNQYTTTIYALVSAVILIAMHTKLPAGLKLYRGLGGDKKFPRSFYKSDAKGRKGILEWGFMSTTASKHIAVQYSGVKEGKPYPTVLEIDSGAVDRGADISGFSQYPGPPGPPPGTLAARGLGRVPSVRNRCSRHATRSALAAADGMRCWSWGVGGGGQGSRSACSRRAPSWSRSGRRAWR